MFNQQLAKIFYQIAEFLEMKEVEFKPKAYEKVARILESMSADVEEIYKKGGKKALEDIPGVGVGIAEKIEEFIKTGRIKDYEELKKKCPVKLDELSAVEGLGPKMIKVLYKKLKIKNLKGLEKAAKAGKIRKIPHFGAKTEENILKSVEFVKRGTNRFLLGHVLPLIRKIEDRFKNLKFISRVAAAGSIRRRQETIGDADLLVVSAEPEEVMDFFVNMPEVKRVYAKGPTKSSVRLKDGMDADIRVVKEKSFGSALQYFTGSKDHNIALRKIAMGKGLKLNEYGLFKLGRPASAKALAGKAEPEIYETLGLAYIEPELRENTGEIELAQKNDLPKIIGYNDIKGDLHAHSNWSDGAYSIEEMAEEAIKMGYQYIAITDHTSQLKIAGGLDEKMVLKQIKEIDKINFRLCQPALRRRLSPRCSSGEAGRQGEGYGGQAKFKIFKGIEVNIKTDGTLDIDDEVLKQLDIVLASVHSGFQMRKEQMTERICRTMENPNVDIISHLTGRVIQKREGYQVDLDKIFEKAKETKTALEINAFPERLDLNDLNIRRAVKAGVKLVVSTDAHNKEQLHFMEIGIAQARRGWAEKKDILNAKSAEELLKKLK